MSPSTRSVVAVVVVLAIAGVAYWAWERFFSHQAQIEAVHRACLDEFASGRDKLKSGLPQERAAARGDPGGDFARDVAKGLRDLIDGVAGSVSEAACGAIRDACRLDFDGDVCSAARRRYGIG